MAQLFSSESLFQRELKRYVYGVGLWFLIGPIYFPAYFTFFIIRNIVHLLAKIFRSDLTPLSKIDFPFIFAPSYTTDSVAYTCQVWKIRGEVSVDAFRNHFQETFLSTKEDREKYRNLYCYFVNFLGYPFKKKVENVDLNHHIQGLKLEKGQTVEDFLGQWMVTFDPCDAIKERPEWVVKIISHSKDSTTILFKLHHGICDGYTIIHLVGKLSGVHAPYTFKEPYPPLLKRLKVFIQYPLLIAEMWTSVAQRRKNWTPFFKSTVNNNDLDWLISFSRLDLETVKQIRRMTGTNFVSVLISIQAGALKRLLFDLSPNKEIVQRIDKNFISHSMGWPQHPVMVNGGGMANHLTINVLTASMQIDDPLERLLDVDKNFREQKQKGFPVSAFDISFNMVKIHPSWVNRQLTRANLSLVGPETFLSTLLCSPEPHYLLGKPVEELYLPVVVPSAYRNMKITTVPVSHSGVLDMSINASREFVKSQEILDRFTKIYFPHELELLRKRTGNIVD